MCGYQSILLWKVNILKLPKLNINNVSEKEINTVSSNNQLSNTNNIFIPKISSLSIGCSFVPIGLSALLGIGFILGL